MATVRFPVSALNADRPGSKTWLNLMWTANTVESDTFGKPVERGDYAGGFFEDYQHARIINDGDSVRVVSRTDHGDEILRDAAKILGVYVHGDIHPYP